MPGTLTPVLAHAGGWDETLMVLVPIGIFAGLLWLANRKAAAAAGNDANRSDGDDAPARSVLRGSLGTTPPPIATRATRGEDDPDP